MSSCSEYELNLMDEGMSKNMGVLGEFPDWILELIIMLLFFPIWVIWIVKENETKIP